MTKKDVAAKRREVNRQALLEGAKLGGQLGQAARHDLRQLSVSDEFQQIGSALKGINAAEADASILKAEIKARLEAAGVEFVPDALVKGGRVDFAVGRVGIIIETGGSGTATAQRLKATDPGRTFGGLVIVGPCGLKGRQPMTPLLVIEPAWEERA